MLVRFWGTRGSIAKSGPQVLRHGGATSCVEVRSASGDLIVIDCGTGAHDLGVKLMREGRPKRCALLISHTHWDHIQGFPFFAPLFAPGDVWDVYAPRGISASLRETLAGQMQYAYFPITLETLGATIHYHDLVEGEFAIGGVRVTAHYLDHPALTLGYRMEADGATLVYACDHEPVSRKGVPGPRELGGAERGHVEFLRGADLVIHDAQYTAEEYPSRIGWGHSTPDYAAAVCLAAGAKRLAMSHHDPARTDAQVDAIVAGLRESLRAEGRELVVEAASDGAEIELAPRPEAVGPRPALSTTSQTATQPVDAALERHRVVFCGLAPEALSVLRAAAEAEDLPSTVEAELGPETLAALGEEGALVAIDGRAAAAGAGEIAAARKAAEGAALRPVIVVADRGEAGLAEALNGAAGDPLIWPFTEQYAQTKLRAAVLRAELRWIRASRPDNEAERLRELRGLGVLDTPGEERFDRIARIASKAFGAPSALITLIDDERQWFKSRVGFEKQESTRETAFCAHAILGAAPLVVPDTLDDARFADNPAVTGEARVRFYAGCPIRSPNGLPLGTLCVIDTRPRRVDEAEIALLKDLAALVEREIATGAEAAPPRSGPKPRRAVSGRG